MSTDPPIEGADGAVPAPVAGIKRMCLGQWA